MKIINLEGKDNSVIANKFHKGNNYDKNKKLKN